MVEVGTEIHTDGWRAYGYLAKAGYTHRVIRTDTDPEVGVNLLPHAHQVASLLKRWLLGTHQGAVTADHLDYYLDEFTFRFNRRTSGARSGPRPRHSWRSAAPDSDTFRTEGE